MTATIQDVAARAGVSTATVSRVLSGADSVAPGTRRKVQAAVEELDFRPSGVARALRRQATATLGLIVTDITNPFYPEIVRGVEDAARQRGYSLLLCNSVADPAREAGSLDLMVERRVDGLLVAAGGLARRHGRTLADFPVPVVLVNARAPVPRLSAVACDDRAGGLLAAEHLLACGYRRIVYIAGPPEADETSQRLEAVREAVGDGLLVVEGDGHFQGGERAMRQALEVVEPPFGVAAHNDLSAVGALRALAAAGVGVPRPVGVVGFDDIALSAFIQPRLTTVSQDKYGMGRWAVEEIHRLLAGGEAQGTYVLPVNLVRRDSTAPLSR